jgi:hypothetical protein
MQSDETPRAARYHVVICGLGRDAATREEVAAMLAADAGWQDEGEYARILDRETGEEFTA